MPLREAIRRYLVWLRAIGTSPKTFPTVQSIFKVFTAWVYDREITMIEQITPDLMQAYQEELTFRLNRDGRPVTIATQLRHLGVLKKLGRFLIEQDLLIADPMKRLRLPRKSKSLPRAIPDVEEAIRLVTTRTEGNGATVYTVAVATRDQTIIELLYNTGLRRGEVVNLNLSDLDLVGGYLWVREGKGRKDRVVPLGKMAIAALEIYLDAVRPVLLIDKEEGALFLNRFGGRLSGEGVYQVVKKAVARAKLSPKITPHSLRHAAATHMLKNGAPIRHLQEFLGHSSVETTQVYTRITIPELKAIHAKYHPREQQEE
jgi:integrase/recombinase XerD